jgi:hypothetical protein
LSPEEIKKPLISRAFLVRMNQCRSGMDCIHWTGIHTSATVDTGIGVDKTLVALLADGVHGAGIFTRSAVCAIFGNGMGHDFTSL